MPTDFAHLHVRSHCSFMGGTATVDDLAARAAADGMARLALTDANGLYGAVAFDRACRAVGVAPILGMALTVAPLAEVARTAGTPPGSPAAAPAELTLLATGPAGYRALCRLSSALQGRPDREAAARQGVGWRNLADDADGLVCIVGGRRGWIGRCLAAGDARAARAYAERLAAVFGDRTYVGLELHGAGDDAIARAAAGVAAAAGLPTVAVQPVFCLAPEDRDRLHLLAAIAANRPLGAVPPDALPDGGDDGVALHWQDPAAIARRFAAFPDAVARAGEVAARCGPALPSGRPIWPALKLPAGTSPDAALRRQAEDGLSRRYGEPIDPATAARLDRELAAIAGHGYAPLFLLVADVVRHARARDVPVSTRGSVANSLVAYAVGITSVDPIAHDLLFERFLNPARSEPPDIDMDFCSRRRDEVLRYVRDTYGAERVALVATVNTLQPKSAIRAAAKAYGLGEAEAGALARLARRRWHPDPRRRETTSVEDTIAGLPDPRHRAVMRAAYAIVGQPDHLGVHPGGVVVAPGPVTDVAPVQWAPKGFLTTQFAHEDVGAVGLVKMDLLGIRALTVLADAADMVRRRHDPGFRLDAIPLDDPATRALLARADTTGVFQCESTGAQRTLRQLKARTVRDLAVANAFFKPGPATGGMADAFVRRYRGEAPVTYLHAALEPILAPTKGVLLFQEQILRVATEVAGLSWADAEHLRRGMSKFRADEMASIRARFVAGCVRPGGPGLSARQAETLWRQVEAFAGYGFNQGHATAYADVSFRSAYLKAHHPAEFLCARLAGWGGFHHPAVYIAEAVRLGIAVRPPHVNHSGAAFTLGEADATVAASGGVDGGVLYMGLGQVRDLRGSAVRDIVRARRERAFGGVRDVLRRVDLRAKEADHLIRAGGLDGLAASRAELLAELADVQRAGGAAQMSFGFDLGRVDAEPAADRLAWERELLGWPVSVHPLDTVARPAGAARLREVAREPSGQPVACAGTRLPGWTGGQGFFLGDGDTFVVAICADGVATPPTWAPVSVAGRWRTDTWGGGWLVVEGVTVLGETGGDKR